MRVKIALMLLVPGLVNVALAEETPSPALLVLNKGHRGSTRPSELAIVDPGSARVVAPGSPPGSNLMKWPSRPMEGWRSSPTPGPIPIPATRSR